MKNTMEYKGYTGTVEYSEKDELLFGKVTGINALVSYEGTDVHSLVEDFHESVDDYLAVCEAENKEPERQYKGCFNVRISPDLHKKAALRAMAMGLSLNSFVESSIELALDRK